MKFNLLHSAFLLCAMIVLPLSSCSDDETFSGDGPAVTISRVSAGAHSLTFSVEPSGADECAWLVVKSGEAVPDAAAVLSGGKRTDAAKRSEVTADGLDAGTEYTVVAAVQGYGKTAVSTLDMSTEQGGSAGLNLEEAVYSTGNAVGTGSYQLIFSQGRIGADGYPVNIGDMLITMDLFNELDADPMNAVLPEGEYTASNGMGAFKWAPSNSFILIRTEAGADGLTPVPIVDGTVNVSRSGNDYTVSLDVVLYTDDALKAAYVGPIVFVQGNTGAYDNFTGDMTLEFQTATSRYYGNWFRPFCDDLELNFRITEKDGDNNVTNEYLLTMPVYMHKLANPKVTPVPLENGTYRVSPTPMVALTSLPMTLEPGELYDFMGDLLPVGTYLLQTDHQSGKQKIGFVKEGTMSVQGSGRDYTIGFDFRTDNGIKIKGTFSGDPKISNFADNSDAIKGPFSSLEEDWVLDFPADAKGDAIWYEDYLNVGCDSWVFQIMGKTGDCVTLELLSPAGSNGTAFSEGTYTVAEMGEFADYRIIPGFVGFGGSAAFSWCADLSTADPENGGVGKMAPAMSGTMKVTKQTDGDYRIVFDFVDDADFSITGEWTGPVGIHRWNDEQPSGASAPKAAPFRARL